MSAPRTSAAPPRCPWRGAAIAAASHLVFCILVQLQNYVLYIRPGAGSLYPTLSFVTRLPFLQLENMGVALTLLLLGRLAAPRVATRAAFVLLALAASLYLIIDQVGFKLYHDHLRYSMLKSFDGFGMVLSSAAKEIDGVSWFNLALWIGLAAWLWRAVVREDRPTPSAGGFWRGSRRAAIFSTGIGIAYLTLSALAVQHAGSEQLQHHPLLAMAGDLWDLRGQPARGANRSYVPDYDRPRAALHPVDFETDIALAQVLSRAHARTKPLNVVLVVMESVGARQLFRDGMPDPELAPSLHRLARNAAVFDSVYTVRPASVDTWIAMLTGGAALDTEPDAGPTLVSRLAGCDYQTGLFASARMAGQGFLDFIDTVGYDTIWDFGSLPETFQNTHNLHSWGGREETAVCAALNWMDDLRPDRPFLLHYYTTATHHPYSTPPEWPRLNSDNSPHSRYREAIRYSDHAIGMLVDALRERQLLNDTLILVTGDHGEAMGQIHPEERLHGSRLFDETIRTFLIVANPGLFESTLSLPRIAGIRDLSPTLFSLLEPQPLLVPGQSLLSREYRPRVAYAATDRLCGLRDANWKVIISQDADPPKLYDLALDPDEQRNLASLHPEEVEVYTDMCLSRMYDMGRIERARQRALSSTLHDARASSTAIEFRGGLDESAHVHFGPVSRVIAATHWVRQDRDRTLLHFWIAPDGNTGGGTLAIAAGETVANVVLQSPQPLTPGVWTWRIETQDDILRLGRFTVSARGTVLAGPDSLSSGR